MARSREIQIVVFEGCPSSLGQVARNLIERGESPIFLCILRPEESSETVQRSWELSIQPLSESAHLMIIHEPKGRSFAGVAEFASELMARRQGELDVLYLSDESSWQGSRRLARQLRELQVVLGKSVSNCVVRRV